MTPSDVLRFGDEIVAALSTALGDAVTGVYFAGSVAVGGFVPGESDIDIVAVCEESLTEQATSAVVEAVLSVTDRCPARGLEFTLYRREVVATAPRGDDAGFEVNVNGGSRMERSIHLDARAEPWFWYVLDRAIVREHGRTITGPPPAGTFAPVDRDILLGAMVESMRWHRRHEGATLYSVLNAARAWRFASDRVLGSKLDGAAWARSRWSRPEVIDAAVELRHGRAAELAVADVDRLLRHVEAELEAARARGAR